MTQKGPENTAGDLPTIHRIVSLEQAANYKRAVQVLGESVSLVSFLIKNEHDIKRLAAAAVAYSHANARTTKTTMDSAVNRKIEEYVETWDELRDDAIAVIVHGPDQATLDGLVYGIEGPFGKTDQDKES